MKTVIIKDIVDELNQKNGSIHKIATLKKYNTGDYELLKRVLRMTYCKVRHTYGVTMLNVPGYTPTTNNPKSLDWALDILEDKLMTRDVTGNDAIDLVHQTLESLNESDSFILEKVLNRDLRINMGRSSINRVHGNLIVKPPYMRCGLYNEKTEKKINYPAYLQQKADGRFVAVTVDNKEVNFSSRSGEENEFPLLEKEFKQLPDGVYIGELLLRGVSNRSIANGLINSDAPPHTDIYMQVWDLVSLDEYSRPKDKDNKTIYRKRIKNLTSALQTTNLKGIELIETHIVKSPKQAMSIVFGWMQGGFEGGVLKDKENIFLDHTSPTQLKMKLTIEADVRCTGFYEGKPGTKREKTFGGITYETDDGKVVGRTSGFTDKQLKFMNNDREIFIGKIFEIGFNDITRSRNSETYALSHPRFLSFRQDKKETDTFERILEMKDMAMGIEEAVIQERKTLKILDELEKDN